MNQQKPREADVFLFLSVLQDQFQTLHVGNIGTHTYTIITIIYIYTQLYMYIHTVYIYIFVYTPTWTPLQPAHTGHEVFGNVAKRGRRPEAWTLNSLCLSRFISVGCSCWKVLMPARQDLWRTNWIQHELLWCESREPAPVRKVQRPGTRTIELSQFTVHTVKKP